jgi:hypothetical protein
MDIDAYIAEIRTNIDRESEEVLGDIPTMQSVFIKYLKITMRDVNDLTNDELDKVKYRNDGKDWDKFCEGFNKLVVAYGMPLIDDSGKDNEFTKTVHYFRNTLNRSPPTLAALKEEKDKWALVSVIGTLYHMYGIDGEYNVKFTSKDDGKYEAVYNIAGSDWKNAPLLNEEEFTQTLLSTTPSYHNMATYNYGKPDLLSSIQDILPCIPNSAHDRLDVQPYKKWGNIDKDYPDDESTWLKCFYKSAILRRNTFTTWLYDRNSSIFRCPVDLGIMVFLHPFFIKNTVDSFQVISLLPIKLPKTEHFT